MKTIINTLFALLCGLAVMATIAVFLPPLAQAQSGTGPHGQKYYDYSGSLIAIPNYQDPPVNTRSCTKDGLFGLHNGGLYVCVAGVWNKITLATVTPTPTATSTPTPTPSATTSP